MIRTTKQQGYLLASLLVATLGFNIIGSTYLQANNLEQAQQERITAYTKLAHLHLPSMAKQEMVERKQADEIAQQNKKIQEENEKKWVMNRTVKNMQVPYLGDAEALRSAYNIFGKNETSFASSSFLKDTVCSDMELFCGGSKAELERHLFGKLDHTRTKFGKIQLQKILAEPQTDVDTLLKRQAIIKNLVEDETLFEKLDASLAAIKNAENNTLWFWKELDDAAEQFFNTAYFQNFFLKGYNTNEPMLETGALWTEIGAPTTMIAYPLIFIGMFALEDYALQEMFGVRIFSGFEANRISLGEIYSRLFNKAKDFSIAAASFIFQGRVEGLGGRAPLWLRGITAALLGVGIYFGWYKGAESSVLKALEFETVSKEIQKRLISTGTFAQSAIDITKTLHNKQLADQLPALKNIAKAFSTAHSEPQAAGVAQNLTTDTFKGEPTFFCNKGRVLSTFKLMYQVRDHFIDTMKAIGEIDAYLSIAKLYKKYAQHPNAQFCFAEYVTNASAPQLAIENFWHPMLNPNTVVTNSIAAGDANHARNIIITGPNAGGKSTVLKSVTLAIILAQTFGIAPAKYMKLTPFTLINTYLNIADTEGRESLFQAEMHRAQDLLHEVRSLKPRNFSFVIMDEIFTGTNPKEGMAGAYGVAKKLSSYQNCLAIIATHFMVLTELEKDTNGLFTNKKVTVDRDAYGTISYPYKLEEGITDQAIALDLLAQSGFDSEILADAQHIMNKQNAYQAIPVH